MSKKKNSHVLIILSDYSDNNNVSSQRIRKFKKYLPASGYDVSILTTTNINKISDKSTKGVYSAFDPQHIYRPILEFLKKRKKAAGKIQRSSENSSKIEFHNYYIRLRKWLLDYLIIPDIKILWLPSAIIYGLYIIHRKRVDVIISSSPFNSMHLTAMCLSMISGKPWVADFRDGWIYDALNLSLRQDCWRRYIESWLEKLVVSRAAAIVAVSKPITEYFCSRYMVENKCFTITNGYDTDDWKSILPKNKNTNKFRIVHTGSFSRSSLTRSFFPILVALQSLPSYIREKIELLLIGSLTGMEIKAIADHKLADVVTCIGQVTHEDSLSYQLSADCLLLSVGEDRSVATSKLFEYLYAKRPILAISASNTAAAEIITEIGAGEIVHPGEPVEIAKHLSSFFERWQRSELSFCFNGIERFDGRELSDKLAIILKNVRKNG